MMMTKIKKMFVGSTMVVAMPLLLNVSSAFAWQFDIRNLDHDLTFDLYFTPDEGGNVVETINLGFGYDGDILPGAHEYMPQPDPLDPLGDTLNFASYTFDMPDFTECLIGASDVPEHDAVIDFAGTGSATLLAETLVGTFTYTGTAVSDGYEDMWWGRITDYYDVTVDGGIYNTTDHASNFVDGGAGASAVPIPGTVLLLGSGLLGMFGLKRKKLSA